MKKPDKRETANLFFSAFLIIAFIVCAYFFTQFSTTLASVPGQIVTIAIYAVFGLLLFYATRVGDGKAVKRFSPVTLIVMVLPSLYVIIASLSKYMPLNSFLAANEISGSISVITTLAAIALGYGIPYTFLSGFELESDDAEEETEETELVKGGIEADILDSAEADEADGEAEADEIEAEGDDADEAETSDEENDGGEQE